ncbi:MAG: type IV secretion system DNA-binding domain-containing protein [Xanthomonadales bacterium]|nr:type IV secretion system DNA-binding domain-containing protein [Xanthomonadales bacterium]
MVYDSWGQPGPHIAPDIPVRRWDQGVAYGALGFLVGCVPLAVGLLGWTDLWRAITQDPAFFSRIDNPQWLRDWCGLAVSVLLGLGLGGGLAWLGLIPRKNLWVVSGPQLLEGKAALREARHRSLPVHERATDPGNLALHPELVLSKAQLSKHVLIYGGVGSGKTQLLLGMLRQIYRRRDRLFLYDVKGDFGSYFPNMSIVSPFDARSRVWHVARDVRTPTQAAVFADSLIPEDKGAGKFWTLAARQVLTGALISLQNEKPEAWTWPDLAQRLALQAEEMAPILEVNYRKAFGLLASPQSQTSFNILATLGSYTRVVDDLARAWPTIGKRWFAITDWVRDDYDGPRQIIVQGGPDATLTAAYISALVNAAVPEIISPGLPDDERGRFIGFVFDELSSIGKIQFAPLVDKGRSKGVVVIACVQDLAQLRDLYGDNQVKALTSMVGTQVICRVGMGETREQLAKLMGTHKLASMNYKEGAVVHTDGAPVVYPHQLTSELGPVKTKASPGYAIRAIVQQQDDLLLLEFPGQPMKVRRPGQVQAQWMSERGMMLAPRKTATGAAGEEGRALDPQELDRIRRQLDMPFEA